MRYPGCGIKSMWLIFRTKMFIYQSKANLDEVILFGKNTHLLDPTIRKMSAGVYMGIKKYTLHPGP